MKILLIALSVLGGVACSGADGRGEDSAPASATPAVSPSGDPSPQPCAAGPTSGEKLTASPVAACEGQFAGTTFRKDDPKNEGRIIDQWLHRTAEGCLFGRAIVLRADGTATAEGVRGTWTGDAFYFQTDIGDRITSFTRTEAAPSK